MKRVGANLLLATAAFAFVLGATELVLRTTHLFGARLAWTRTDNRIGWRFVPSSAYWFFGENDHAIHGRINAHGWRDRERQVVRTDGPCRIAVLGDSFVEAFQVESDSTFCAIAERTLQATWRGAEVLNFGRSGVTQTEEWLLVDEVLSYHPDAVIVLFVPHNDIADIAPSTATNPLRPFASFADGGSPRIDFSFHDARGCRVRRAIGPLKRHSALISLLAQRYNALTRAHRLDALVRHEGDLSGPLTLCTRSPKPRVAAHYALCLRMLGDIAERFRRDGVRVAFASVPMVYTTARINALQQIDESFDPMRFENDLARVARAHGAALIALQKRFEARAAAGERLTWTHFTYAGHREVARATVKFAQHVCRARTGGR